LVKLTFGKNIVYHGNMLIKLIVSTLAVLISAYILPGVKVDGFVTAVVVAVVLGAINMFIRPILLLLTFPLTVLSLGLFTFVINALLVLLVSSIVPGFHVESFFWALVFSLVLSLVNSFLNSMTKK
jgi:putative membrane protein